MADSYYLNAYHKCLPLNRLSSATETGATTNVYSYGYDNAGNRTSVTANGVTTSRTYNAANQVNGWSYDAADKLLSDSTSTYTYDVLNRVGSIASAGQMRSNAYNGDGTLVAQTVGGTTHATPRISRHCSLRS